MVEFSLKDVKIILSRPPCKPISNQTSKQYLTTAIKVIHHTLQLWYEFSIVHQVEVYFIFSSDVYSDIAFLIEYVSFVIKSMIELPLLPACAFIRFTFKKQYFRTAVDDQCLLIEEKHLAKVFLGYSF